MSDAFFRGFSGQQLIVKTNRDLTGATSVLLKVQKPDKTVVTWTPTSYNLSTGDINYVTEGTADVNLVGEYVVQACVEIAGTPLPPGRKGYLKVTNAIWSP
jgi:hypothetical protein